jgi:large subunit ribosomal protein L7/L12
MPEQINTIIEQLKNLTLIEAAELVKQIEKIFYVQTSVNSDNKSNINETKTEDNTEVKTEFNLILVEVPSDKKIPILKVVRSLTGLGLKEVKELVESAPKEIKKNMNKSDAEEAKKQIESVGGKASLE